MKNCTGILCPMQYGKVDPATCQAVDYCPQATPPKTNADRIRSMTDEELAGWLERIRLCCATDLCGRNCPFAEVCYSSAAVPKETLDWLKQEAE
jgi:hypothetical protein